MPPKIHFHTLDALRFFAFFKVFFLHIPLEGDQPVLSFLKSGGGIGVTFFFVLSGFLITYILSYEKLHVGHINIGKFFLRRSFRIWPLFFLVVGIVAIIPYDIKQSIGLHMIGNGYSFDWKYSFTFLENYKMLLEDNQPKTTPLSVFWSLCIEEHFYILWMLVIFLIPAKRIPLFLICSIIISWIARYLEPGITHNDRIMNQEILTNLDNFAIGGLPAYFVAKNYERVAAFIMGIPSWTKYAYLFLALVAVIFQTTIFPITNIMVFDIFRPTLIALLFVGIICVFIPQDSKIRINDNNILSKLGRISYGLYVYHLIFIHVMFQFCKFLSIKMDDVWSVLIFTLIALFFSIIIASISYLFFEKKFMELREKFYGAPA